MGFQRRVIFILWALNFCIPISSGETCGGGILEGDSGKFASSARSTSELQQPCFWIIKTIKSSRVLFKADNLDSESAFHLYPDHDPTETFFQPIVLTASNLSSTVETEGKNLIVILVEPGNRNQPFSFSWSSNIDGGAGGIVYSASYIDNSQGSFTREQLDYPQKNILALNSGTGSDRTMSVEGEVKFSSCDLIDPCQCSYFGLYEVLPSGYLREVHRVCGRSRTFSESDLSPSLIQFVYITRGPTQVDDTNSVDIRWNVEEGEEPPPPTTTTTITTTTEDTETTPTTTPEPQPFMCPAPEDIAPCTCYLSGNSGTISCYGREVTQSSIDRVFPALASANPDNNSGKENALIQLSDLKISSSNLPKLDLTSLVNANVSLDTLTIAYNNYLVKFEGPNLAETNDGNQKKIVARSIILNYQEQLKNEGFGNFLRYFDPLSLRNLDLERNRILGDKFPIADGSGSGDIEFLPGLSAFTNLEEINIGEFNYIRYIGGGQFKRNRNLRKISLRYDGAACVFDNDAFLLDPPDVAFAWNETLLIDFTGSHTTNDMFNGSSSTFSTGRPTEVNLSYNELRSVRQEVFEDFLLAHERNKLDFSSNKIQCNSDVRWLKEQREEFEPRVFGLNCANDPGESVFTSDLV